MIELLAIGQQIEDKDFHWISLPRQGEKQTVADIGRQSLSRP